MISFHTSEVIVAEPELARSYEIWHTHGVFEQINIKLDDIRGEGCPEEYIYRPVSIVWSS